MSDANLNHTESFDKKSMTHDETEPETSVGGVLMAFMARDYATCVKEGSHLILDPSAYIYARLVVAISLRRTYQRDAFTELRHTFLQWMQAKRQFGLGTDSDWGRQLLAGAMALVEPEVLLDQAITDGMACDAHYIWGANLMDEGKPASALDHFDVCAELRSGIGFQLSRADRAVLRTRGASGSRDLAAEAMAVVMKLSSGMQDRREAAESEFIREADALREDIQKMFAGDYTDEMWSRDNEIVAINQELEEAERLIVAGNPTRGLDRLEQILASNADVWKNRRVTESRILLRVSRLQREVGKVLDARDNLRRAAYLSRKAVGKRHVQTLSLLAEYCTMQVDLGELLSPWDEFEIDSGY